MGVLAPSAIRRSASSFLSKKSSSNSSSSSSSSNTRPLPKLIDPSETTTNHSNTSQQKRCMKLSIAPDTESESMQVLILPEEESPVKKKKSVRKTSDATEQSNENDDEEEVEEEDRDMDCIYTVGSVQYTVKHDVNSQTSTSSEDKDAAAAGGGGGGGDSDDVNGGALNNNAAPDSVLDDKEDGAVIDAITNPNHRAEEEEEEEEPVASEGGGGNGEKKKSSKGKFGFKKSLKKGGGGDDNNKKGGGSNNNHHSGDNNNNDDEKKAPPGPRPVSFTPQRIAFADQSTLPLHLGPESSAPKTHPSWTPVSGTEFKVRAGPNYPKNGRKERSLESLYEVYCVRYFRSEKRTVGGATRIMPLPEMGERIVLPTNKEGGETEESTTGEKDATTTTTTNNNDTHPNNGSTSNDGDNDDNSKRPKMKPHPELAGTSIPDILVVHFMLPYDPPNMFKQTNDGPGGECIYYLRPSQRFLDQLSGRAQCTPAASLFRKWCAECTTDCKMRSRFKCMALVRDIDRHNFGLLKNYNGKPVLITESGRVSGGYHEDVRYLEMTANVHHWAFMAKKGFVSLIPKFANMQMEVGFTIEAHADSEMPECMLGSTVLSYINEMTGPMITAEMQEPVHEHQS